MLQKREDVVLGEFKHFVLWKIWMAGQECGKDQAELWYGGTIAFPSEHKTKLVRNRSVPFRSVPFRPRLNMASVVHGSPVSTFTWTALDGIDF